MDGKYLPKSEFDSANHALESILNEPVEDIDLTDMIPLPLMYPTQIKCLKGSYLSFLLI
ncbi:MULTISPECIES: hypothetical protein [Acutalibacteraceae]|uniref:hypothetical protein n=1 Tax=Acutalibacteraceae TaxID=3082771 RepID=UPI0013E8E257|nr:MULTISPECIES: hypothetical protein [Acutalibacteraceae]